VIAPTIMANGGMDSKGIYIAIISINYYIINNKVLSFAIS